MTTGEQILLVFGMMAVTFGVRYPVLALVGRMELPPAMIRGLKYVPPAVLTAIIVPAVFIQEGEFSAGLNNAYLIGAIVSVLIAWRTKSLLWTITVGMAVFLLWRGLM